MKLRQEHARIVRTENIEKVKVIAKADMINPFGGRRGSFEKTISGHENALIAKYRVIGILISESMTSCSMEVS